MSMNVNYLGRTETVSNLGGTETAGESVTDSQKEEKINKLIGNFWTTSEAKVDEAFEIAKGIKDKTMLHFMLSDICNAYINFSGQTNMLGEAGCMQCCRKAFLVAQYKEEQGADIRILLNNTVKGCLLLNTKESQDLAKDIFRMYPKQMAYSEHKNAVMALF